MAWRLGDWAVGQGLFRRSGRAVGVSAGGPADEHTLWDGQYPEVERLPIFYTCVTKVVDALLGLPPKVLRADGTEVARLPYWLQDPNPLQDLSDLLSAAAVSLLLEGEAFLFPVRDRSNRTTSVGVVDPRRVHYQYRAGGIVWYVNGRRSRMEFVHIRHLTAPGRVAGIPRVRAVRDLSNISRGSLTYTQQHLTRGGAYQLILQGDDRKLDTVEGRAELREMIKQLHAGWRNAFNALILPGKITVVPMDPKLLNADNGFLDLMQATDRSIAASFGIDPFEVGLAVPGSSRTYVNEPARLYKLHSNAVQPVARKIEAALTAMLPAGQSFKLDDRAMLLGGPHDRMTFADKAALANERSIKAGMGPLFSRSDIRAFVGLPGPPPELGEDDVGLEPEVEVEAPAAPADGPEPGVEEKGDSMAGETKKGAKNNA